MQWYFIMDGLLFYLFMNSERENTRCFPNITIYEMCGIKVKSIKYAVEHHLICLADPFADVFISTSF